MSDQGLMTREEALNLLKQYLKDERMVKHCLAVEAIMRALARRLGEDEELWGLVGLLHDIDYEVVGKDLSKHGLVGANEVLKGKLPQHALEAIAGHNELTGVKPSTPEAEKLLHALRAADHMSGLIIATALVMPSKKLAEVKPKSVKKKFKSKDFARGVSRDRIREIEKLGIDLNEFITLSLQALKNIADSLGL